MTVTEEKNQPLWRQELQWRNFGFGHRNPCLFVEPQCGHPSLLYLVWLVLAAIYFPAVLIYGAVTWEYGAKWFIYISNWTYLLLVIYSILRLSCCIYHYRKYRKVRQEVESPYRSMPVLWQLTWLLGTLLYVLAPMVAIGYWLVIYRFQWDLSIYNITTHGIGALYILIDMWIGGGPVRILHFYVPILFGLFYTLFTYVYFLGGGTDVYGNRVMYEYLDYDNYPNYSLMIILSLILLTLVVHLIMFALFRLKRSVHKRYCCSPCRGYHDQYPENSTTEYAEAHEVSAENSDTTPQGNHVTEDGGTVSMATNTESTNDKKRRSKRGRANGMAGNTEVGGVSGGGGATTIPFGTVGYVGQVTLAPVGTISTGQGASIIMAPVGEVRPQSIAVPVGTINQLSVPQLRQGGSISGTFQPMGGVTQPVGGDTQVMSGITQPMGGVTQIMGGVTQPMGGVTQIIGGVTQPMGGITQPVGGVTQIMGGVSDPVVNVGGAYRANPSLGPGETFRYSTHVGRAIPFMISELNQGQSAI